MASQGNWFAVSQRKWVPWNAYNEGFVIINVFSLCVHVDFELHMLMESWSWLYNTWYTVWCLEHEVTSPLGLIIFRKFFRDPKWHGLVSGMILSKALSLMELSSMWTGDKDDFSRTKPINCPPVVLTYSGFSLCICPQARESSHPFTFKVLNLFLLKYSWFTMMC